ncbi:MAG TPA: hypothetical protein VMF69_10545 [Gemmataceae bacterium]|nr:hypothetical protein [Gemmataceae bacterium]
MITLLVTGLLLIALGAGGGTARADDGCCGSACGGRGSVYPCGFVPNVTYYAPYPLWFPKYFGPPYTDYQVVQYITPPAESAEIIKQRIFAINAGNPALLFAPKEPLPAPKPDKLPAPQK